jgi:hypothetical protein
MRLYFRTFIMLLLSEIYHNTSQWGKKKRASRWPGSRLGGYLALIPATKHIQDQIHLGYNFS